MKTIFKFALYGLLAIFGIAVVLGIVFVIQNLRDERLDPEVARLLEYSPPQIAAGENGYFAWIGIVGPESETPHAWGRRWYEEARAADMELARGRGIGRTRRGRRAANNEPRRPRTSPATTSPPVSMRWRRSRPLPAPCWRRSGPPSIVPTRRSPSRRTRSRGAPTAASSRHLPVTHRFGTQLSATRFALSVAEGRHDEALDRLAQAVAFHTRQLQGAETPVAKMIAISYLRNDYQLLNQYLLRYPAEAARRASRLEALLAPLPAKAVTMENVMRTECAEGVRLFLNLKQRAHREIGRNGKSASARGHGRCRGRLHWPPPAICATRLPTSITGTGGRSSLSTASRATSIARRSRPSGRSSRQGQAPFGAS